MYNNLPDLSYAEIISWGRIFDSGFFNFVVDGKTTLINVHDMRFVSHLHKFWLIASRDQHEIIPFVWSRIYLSLTPFPNADSAVLD